MECKDLVKDFACRTRANLRVLRLLRDQGGEVYDVTALINSMLGLLIFPQQAYVDSLPEVPLDRLLEQGWPAPRVIGSYPQVRSLRELVRYLRNAIAHFNIEFLSSNGTIDGIVVWNVEPRTSKTTWKASLSLHDLDVISQRFVELLLDDRASTS